MLPLKIATWKSKRKCSSGVNVAKVTVSRGVALADGSLVKDEVTERADIFLRAGAGQCMQAARKHASLSHAGKFIARPVSETAAERPMCRNYGCQQRFDPTDNDSTSCLYHVAPPLFHETKKSWTCCPDIAVYDWDDFVKIPGCTRGPHSTVDPRVKFAKSPTAVAAAAIASASSAAPAPALKSIDDYNAANSDAPTAAGSAKQLMTSQRVSKPRADGRIQCVNHGCQVAYLPEENNPSACKHHTKPPVFHDRMKFWGCCPDQQRMDFEDFLQVPGCVESAHSDRT